MAQRTQLLEQAEGASNTDVAKDQAKRPQKLFTREQQKLAHEKEWEDLLQSMEVLEAAELLKGACDAYKRAESFHRGVAANRQNVADNPFDFVPAPASGFQLEVASPNDANPEVEEVLQETSSLSEDTGDDEESTTTIDKVEAAVASNMLKSDSTIQQMHSTQSMKSVLHNILNAHIAKLAHQRAVTLIKAQNRQEANPHKDSPSRLPYLRRHPAAA
ncbi:MAG: hypothetical protein MHM6MM_007324, partial [Cercozoa sp. M6MM]